MSLPEILQELFHVSAPHELDTARLNTLQQQYPWFETLHIAHALHDAATGLTAAPSFSQAALVTGNELWLQVLLDEAARSETVEQTATTETATVQPQVHTTIVEPVPASAAMEAATLPEASHEYAVAETMATGQEPTALDAAAVPVVEQPRFTEPETTTAESIFSPEPGIAKAAETAVQPDIPVAETGLLLTEADPEPGIPQPADMTESVAHIEAPADDAAAVNLEKPTEDQPITEIPPPVAAALESPAAEPAVPLNNQPVAATAPAPVGMTETPAPDIPLEPYHTIDYFAAVGVKPDADDKPRDRLGRQLKSFTGWLKSLKKLPGGRPAESISEAENEKVEQMATDSVKDTEVVTETMAEVLASQGRVDEAIDILRKLSLQDSGKSAYFAARIAHLKLK